MVIKNIKKYLLILSIVFFGLVSFANAQEISFSRDLSLGMTSNDVAELQTWLISNSYDIPAISSGLANKGYFGAQTKLAVIKYQIANNLPGTGFVGPMTRARLKGTKSSAIKVLSPNGGESLALGSVQNISWTTSSASDNPRINIILVRNASSCFNLSPGMSCLPVMDPVYTIASDIPNTGSYSWNVGTYSQVDYGGLITAGNYYIRVCKGSDKSVGSCDTSDALFSIVASDSQAPVINGIDAPTTLNVNQTGTWIVRAADPQNGTLSYSVDWGDMPTSQVTCPTGYTCQPISVTASVQQGSTFTHSYSIPGTHIVWFTVKNSAGLVTKSSVTVVVGNINSNSLRIISPNGGEDWQRGTIQNITWTSPVYFRATSADIKLIPYDYCPPNNSCPHYLRPILTIVGNIDINRNSYSWNVGDVVNYAGNTPGYISTSSEISNGQYTIQICESGTNNCDSSDKPFTIKSKSLPSVVKVTSPNGGETWQSNSVHQIAWSMKGSAYTNSDLDLYLDSDVVCPAWTPDGLASSPFCPPNYVLDKKISASTIYNWIVATDINNMKIPTGAYRVRACLSGSTTNCDSSDSFFTITE